MRRGLAGTATLAVAAACAQILTACGAGKSTCDQARAAANGYLTDYYVSEAVRASNYARLPPMPTSAQPSAIENWELALQRDGVGESLTVGDWAGWEEAYDDALNAGEQPARSQAQDAKLFDAVVDQNPSCFSPSERAQVKVNEGS